jgi:hypothetical protein
VPTLICTVRLREGFRVGIALGTPGYLLGRFERALPVSRDKGGLQVSFASKQRVLHVSSGLGPCLNEGELSSIRKVCLTRTAKRCKLSVLLERVKVIPGRHGRSPCRVFKLRVCKR